MQVNDVIDDKMYMIICAYKFGGPHDCKRFNALTGVLFAPASADAPVPAQGVSLASEKDRGNVRPSHSSELGKASVPRPRAGADL